MKNSHLSPPTTPKKVLRWQREQRGWSQAYVAREVGTDARTVSRWERGVTHPSLYFRQQLCRLFAMDAQALGLLETVPDRSASSLISVPSPLLPLIDPARPRLNVPLSSLIERSVLLDHVFSHLATGTSCILYGLPGVGKTTLAHQLSTHSRCQVLFPDGILWIRLGPTPQIQHELLRLATILQIAKEHFKNASTIHDLAHLIHEALGERRILLVIDDAWRIQDVSPFLVGGQHTAHLITSRLPEIAYAFTEGLPVHVPELTLEQSTTLLSTLVPHLSDTEEVKVHVQSLLQTAGGLPLAITLLGHTLRLALIGGQHRRLQAALTRLSEGLVSMPGLVPPLVEEPASLATIIGLSERALSPSTREMLRALSVFPAKPASFSEAAALAVSTQGLEGLDQLLHSGLHEGAGEGRYCIHQLIADYARLHQHDEGPLQRLVAYACEVSQDPINHLPTLMQDWAVLQAAWNAAQQHEWNDALFQLTEQLDEVYYAQGYHHLAIQRLQNVYALAKQRHEYLRMCKLLHALATHMKALGDTQQAFSFTEASLQLAEHYGFIYEQVRSLNSLGVLATMKGHLNEAVSYYQAMLTLASALETSLPRLAGLTNIGSALFEQGLFLEAEATWQEGLRLSQQAYATDWQCGFLQSLTSLYLHWASHMEQAELTIRQARELAEMLQDRYELVSVAIREAQVRCRKGAFAQTEACLQEALQKAEQGDHLQLRYQTLVESASLFVMMHRVQQAEACLLRLTPWSSIPGIAVELRAKEQLAWGELRLAQGRPAEASLHFQAVQRWESSVSVLLSLQRSYGLARSVAEVGKWQEARRLGQECLTAMRQHDYWQLTEAQHWFDHLPTSCPGFNDAPVHPPDTSLLQEAEVAHELRMMSHEWSKSIPSCPQCQSQDEVRLHGKNRSGEQRYRCLSCQYAFVPFPKRIIPSYPLPLREQAGHLSTQGKSLRAIARELGVHHETVRRWLLAKDELAFENDGIYLK